MGTDGLSDEARSPELLQASIERVWNERSADARRDALGALYASDVVLYRPDATAVGHRGVSAKIDAMAAALGPAARLRYISPIGHHHGMAIGHWVAEADGVTLATGTDMVRFEKGKVREMYVFLDTRDGGPLPQPRHG